MAVAQFAITRFRKRTGADPLWVVSFQPVLILVYIRIGVVKRCKFDEDIILIIVKMHLFEIMNTRVGSQWFFIDKQVSNVRSCYKGALKEFSFIKPVNAGYTAKKIRWPSL